MLALNVASTPTEILRKCSVISSKIKVKFTQTHGPSCTSGRISSAQVHIRLNLKGDSATPIRQSNTLYPLMRADTEYYTHRNEEPQIGLFIFTWR